MRFLFINQYYAPDFAATAQQMQDLCESLAAAGHEVFVLTGKSLYDGRDIDLPSEETLNGVKVYRVPIGCKSRQRFRDRLIGYASFFVRAFIKGTMIPRCDVVVTLTTPPLISLLGAWLRVVRKSRFVYWVMDIYPDIALRAGVLRKVGIAANVWNAFGKLSYSLANRVVVLGDCMKQALADKGVSDKKLHVIQSWACGSSIVPVENEDNEFRKEFLRDEKFTLMYSGNMGTCHTFDAVVGGIKQLSSENSEHDFVFVGSGKKEGELRDRLSDCGDDVRFLPYQEREKLAESLSAPDAHLITLEPLYDGLLVPSKLYGIMAAGRPIVFVGSGDNEVANIIDRARCGIRIDPDDSEGFAAALRQLSSNPEEAAQMGHRGRRYFERWFERHNSCANFMKLLEAEAHRPGVRGQRVLAHHVMAAGPATPDPEHALD